MVPGLPATECTHECVQFHSSWCICCLLPGFHYPRKTTLGDSVLYTPARPVLPKGRQHHHTFLVVSEAELRTEVTRGGVGRDHLGPICIGSQKRPQPTIHPNCSPPHDEPQPGMADLTARRAHSHGCGAGGQDTEGCAMLGPPTPRQAVQEWGPHRHLGRGK